MCKLLALALRCRKRKARLCQQRRCWANAGSGVGSGMPRTADGKPPLRWPSSANVGVFLCRERWGDDRGRTVPWAGWPRIWQLCQMQPPNPSPCSLDLDHCGPYTFASTGLSSPRGLHGACHGVRVPLLCSELHLHPTFTL